MRVGSVNIATAPAELRVGGWMTRTGIDKRPADRPVAVGTRGPDGDTISSGKHHGGPDRAVYVYGEEDDACWEAELGRALPPGTFGENLTVTARATAASAVGDRLRVGDEVVLEVTCGRIPCGTLTARMGIRAFAQRFRKAARPGLYCRVIETGSVAPGDAVAYEPATGPRLGIVEFGEMFYARELTREDQLAALASP